MSKLITITFTRHELKELLSTARAGNFGGWEFYQDENSNYVISDGAQRLRSWQDAINKICEALHVNKNPIKKPTRKAVK